MKLVVDTNRIMAALIKKSLTRRILFSKNFDFFTPEGVFDEIMKYKDYIIQKADIFQDEFQGLFREIIDQVNIVSLIEYQKKLSNAKLIMDKIDPNDTIFIACGLAVQADGIWTEDGHFEKQNTIKMYLTKKLAELI